MGVRWEIRAVPVVLAVGVAVVLAVGVAVVLAVGVAVGLAVVRVRVPSRG